MTDKHLPPFTEWPVLVIRGQRVMLDTDLARLFCLSMHEIEQRVKRNRSRFPKDFLFRLTAAERDELATVCRHLRKLRFSRTLPLAFTEPGVLMLTSVLEGPRAEAMSVEIIRAFIRVREVAANDPDFVKSLQVPEVQCNRETRKVFDAIRQLMEPQPERPRPRIQS